MRTVDGGKSASPRDSGKPCDATAGSIRDATRDRASAVTDARSGTSETDGGADVLGAVTILYQLGGADAKGAEGQEIQVEGTNLYWFETDTSLWRGDTRGRKEAVRLVDVTGGGGLVVDETRVYWDGYAKIGVYDKTTGAVSSIPVDRDYPTMHLMLDDRNVYFFQAGCKSIGMVAKSGGAPDVVSVALPNNIGTTSTIAQDATYVYCGDAFENGESPRIYRRAKAGGPALLIATIDASGERCQPQIKAMSLVRDQLYFALAYECIGLKVQFQMMAVPASGGTPRVVSSVAKGIGQGTAVYDEGRHMMYFWAVIGRYMAAYDVNTHAVYEVNEGADKLVYGDSPHQDADALYWAGAKAIYRQAKLSPRSASLTLP